MKFANEEAQDLHSANSADWDPTVNSTLRECEACGQSNRVGGSEENKVWKCGRCGARLNAVGFAHPDVIQFSPRSPHTLFPIEVARFPVSIGEWNEACDAGAPLRRDPHLRVAPVLHEDPRLQRHRDLSGKCATADWDEAQAYVSFLNQARGLAGRPDRFRLPYQAEITSLCHELRYFEGVTYHWCEAELEVPKKLDPRVGAKKRPAEAVMPQLLHPATDPAGRCMDFRKVHRLGVRLVRPLPTSAAGEVAFPKVQGTVQRHFKYDAFLSHNQRDGSVELAEVLTKHGLVVWHDADADMSDQRVIDLVFGTIPQARLLCLCVGPDFRDSQWVREEYQFGVALEHGAGAIRVVVVELAPNVAVPAELEHKLRIPAYNGPEILAAHLLIANTAANAGEFEWMVRADHARLLREGAVAAKECPDNLVSRHARRHEVWISVGEQQKLDEAFNKHARERGNPSKDDH